jgi:hypothetical protein
MKKILTLTTAFIALFTLSACVLPIGTVLSLELNQVLPPSYDVDPQGVDISDVTATIVFEDPNPTIVVPITDSRIQVSGAILPPAGDDKIVLDTSKIGRQSVTISADDLSVTYHFWVEDDDWLADINYLFQDNTRATDNFVDCILAIENACDLEGLINPTNLELSYFIPIDVLEYFQFWYHDKANSYTVKADDTLETELSGFVADIWVTLQDEGNFPDNEFSSTAEALEIVIAALTHRTLTADGRALVNEVRDTTITQDFTYDWDRLMINLYDSYVSAPEAMKFTSGGEVFSRDLLIDYYSEMLYGGNDYLPGEWPGFLNVDEDYTIATDHLDFEPGGYSQISNALVGFITTYLEE